MKNKEDTEECVNDTYMRAWHAMPPQRPSILQAFLGKITRNLCLDRYKAGKAGKRGGGQIAVALEELSWCMPGGEDPAERMDAVELGAMVDRFLRTLPEKECCIFMRRYWYVDSMLEIAHRYHMAEGSVKSSLHRTRQKLKDYLQQQGVSV